MYVTGEPGEVPSTTADAASFSKDVFPIKENDNITVTIMTLNGTRKPLNISSNATLWELKQQIYLDLNLDYRRDDVKLSLYGKKLNKEITADYLFSINDTNTGKTLSELNIGNGTQIRIILVARGGIMGGKKKTRRKKRRKKKKTRKRLYFKDLLDNVQSGGLIPRRIYFNDLL